MMILTLRDYRKIERADIEIDGVTIVSGPNSVGKSSVCGAVASILTGATWQDMKKKDAGALVRTGADGASIRLTGEAWDALLTYPKGETTTDGPVPKLSAVAAGLAILPLMSDKDRANLIARYIDAAPNRADLEAALSDADVPVRHADAVWEKIAAQGWDGAWVNAKERGATMKGQWTEVTRAGTWGDRKAAAWVPDGWDPEMDNDDLGVLEKAVEDTARAAEDAVAAAAIGEAEQKALQAKALRLQVIDDEIATAQEAADKAAENLAAAQKALADLPSDEELRAEHTCPHCDQPIVALTRVKKNGEAEYERTTTLHKPDAVKKAPAAGGLAKVRAEARRTVEARREVDKQDSRRLNELLAEKIEATKARDRLAALEDATAQPAADLEAARAARDAAKARLTRRQTRDRAAKIHATICVNQALVDVLAPDGLRKRVLARKLEEFNEKHLMPLAAAAGWLPVRIEPDLTLTYGAIDYVKLGGHGAQALSSDQLRAVITLQVAISLKERASLIICDGVDLLDKEGRNGLLKMLMKFKVTCLLGMTEWQPERLPNLDAKGVGRCYWIENGIARPLAEVLAKKAA